MDGGTFDGLTMDQAGCVWVARWKSECDAPERRERGARAKLTLVGIRAGSRVVKYNSDGSIGLEVRFPKAANITCCIFGGESR